MICLFVLVERRRALERCDAGPHTIQPFQNLIVLYLHFPAPTDVTLFSKLAKYLYKF